MCFQQFIYQQCRPIMSKETNWSAKSQVIHVRLKSAQGEREEINSSSSRTTNCFPLLKFCNCNLCKLKPGIYNLQLMKRQRGLTDSALYIWYKSLRVNSSSYDQYKTGKLLILFHSFAGEMSLPPDVIRSTTPGILKVESKSRQGSAGSIRSSKSQGIKES